MNKAELVARFMSGVYGLTLEQANVVADYVIADRERIVEPLIKNVKELGESDGSTLWLTKAFRGYLSAVLETIKRSGVLND